MSSFIPAAVRQEVARRCWAARDLAREAKISEATVSAALAGRPIAASSVALIARALSRVPTSDVIDSLLLIEPPANDLS